MENARGVTTSYMRTGMLYWCPLVVAPQDCGGTPDVKLSGCVGRSFLWQSNGPGERSPGPSCWNLLLCIS